MKSLRLSARLPGHVSSRWLLCGALGLLALVAVPGSAGAQTGVITGRVVDAEIGAPLTGTVVEVITATGQVRKSTTTEDDGTFRLVELPAGMYTVLISTLGYESHRVERVSVGEEPVRLGTISLISRAFRLNPVVVTASREQEKALESPASVHTISTEEVQEKTATTSVDYVRGVPGVDIATTGVHQHNVVARGFNNVFSGALFVLTDNRWASVPSLRFNAYNLIPTTPEDIERIELVLGPGSALYGPNVDKGVMHIITRSPLEQQETSVSVTGGARSGNRFGDTQGLWQGTLRHSGLFSESVGYKVSAMYFRGEDWKFIDPVEAENRQEAIEQGANPDTLLIGRRDFTAERLTVDARVDWQLDDESTMIFSGGLANMMSSIEMTGIGSAQAENWVYSYAQARFRRGNLFAQSYINFSDAGDSYRLRNGEQVVDNSLLYVGQVQHATDLSERQRFVYGADLIRTVPRTEGTIHGRNESSDNITEVGGYLQSETELSRHFDLVLAGRLDYHSRVENLFVSPRAAVVYKPTPEHNIRFTYNRAFSQPSSINMSLDLESTSTLGPFQAFGVRALGVPPETGLTFRRDCAGGLCMRSPFAEDPTQFLPLDVTPYWDEAVDGLNAILQSRGQPPLDPALEAFLRTLDPSDQVSTVLKTFDAEALAFGSILTPEQAAIDVAPIEPSITNTLEVGYKGLIGDRLLLGVDVYYQRVEDFIGPLRFETPNAFLSATDLAQFLEGPLLAAGVPPDQIPTIIAGLSNVPLGTVTPEQVPSNHPTDLYVTYRNFGSVDLWGTDIGLTFLFNDQLSFTGSYSLACGWIDSDNKCENFFPNQDNIGDLALNAPRNKASLSAHYRNQRLGLELEFRSRYVDSYRVSSGVFEGFIPSFTLFDANVTYILPLATSPRLTLTANNIFDNDHQEMVGAPFIGRVLMLRLSQEF